MKTRTPGELNETTGLTFTRAAARRLMAHSSVTRHLNPVSTGTIDYSVTQDHLAGGAGATTHNAALGIQRHRSVRETVTLDYRFRDYVFVGANTSGLGRNLPRGHARMDARDHAKPALLARRRSACDERVGRRGAVRFPSVSARTGRCVVDLCPYSSNRDRSCGRGRHAESQRNRLEDGLVLRSDASRAQCLPERARQRTSRRIRIHP